MYAKRNYGFWMTFNWSKKPFIYGFIYAAIVSIASYVFEFDMAIPWQPISVIAITVAFYLGFKNNSSYERTWEARKIWGGIVNNSRSFGAAVVSFVKGAEQEEIRKELIYRHIAWLTALRFQLRLSRVWEHVEERLSRFNPNICEEFYSQLDTELLNYIDKEETDKILKSGNMATQIMANQSKRLQELRDKGYFEDFRHMEMYQLIRTFYDDQGKSERIKNFPFPRQYASTAMWLTMVFAAFLPWGILDIFHETARHLIWLCPFISGLITWMFFLMEKIGDYSENPFEGTYNDVPITTISRGIEIDMREMINDHDIPPALEPQDGFLL